MRRQQQVEPKPFVLVPIPKEKPQKSKAVTFEKFNDLTGQLDLKFEVVSEYLFVGSGGYEFDPDAKGDRPDVWHTFYRRNGQICVPGTSLKGSIRAIVEAISNSCILQTRRNEQVSSQHRRCEFKRIDESQLCPACRLFGTTGLRGRVIFSDATPMAKVSLVKVKIAELWEPRQHRNARRFYEVKSFITFPNQKPERNCRFVEAVPRGATFRVALRFENLTEAELGLLLHALGWQVKSQGVDLNAFTPKIGGAKPRCFGAVKFEPKRALLWQFDNWESLLNPKALDGNELTQFIQTCLKACQIQNLLHNESWQVFTRGMKLKSEPCPRGNY